MIKFILNNQVVKTTANAGMTLLDFIREHKQLKGTKIGCREGDCGACTVLVGTLTNNKINYQSITSCISPLGNANGKHIVTIEGINLPENLNFVQQTMVDNYATQCGYCTPGFVVSLAGYAIEKKPQTQSTCNDAISGNICRCTGYKSIEKATVSVDNKLVDKDENHQIEWLIKEGFIPNYFINIPNKLQKLQLNKLSKEGTVVANGTDLYVQNADHLVDPINGLLTVNGGGDVTDDLAKIATRLAELINTNQQAVDAGYVATADSGHGVKTTGVFNGT